MERNVKQVLSGVGFYGTLAVCLAVVGVCGWVLLRGEGREPVQELPVTPQAAVENAKPPIAITHAPGHMFITDIINSELNDFLEAKKNR